MDWLFYLLFVALSLDIHVVNAFHYVYIQKKYIYFIFSQPLQMVNIFVENLLKRVYLYVYNPLLIFHVYCIFFRIDFKLCTVSGY
jgi:hypothetical protein